MTSNRADNGQFLHEMERDSILIEKVTIGVLQMIMFEKQAQVFSSIAAKDVLKSVDALLNRMQQLVEVTSNSAENFDFYSLVMTLKQSAESFGYVSTEGFKNLLEDQGNSSMVLYDGTEAESFSDNEASLNASSVSGNEEEEPESDDSVFDPRYVNQQIPQKRINRRRTISRSIVESSSSDSENALSDELHETKRDSEDAVVNDSANYKDIKEFLMKIGPSAIAKVSCECTDIEIDSDHDIGELTEVLHKLLKDDQALSRLSNNYKANLGQVLLLLHDLFQQRTELNKGQRSKEFFAYVYEVFKIKSSSYYNYKNYCEIVRDYPRFMHVPISFRAICKWISKIRQCFKMETDGQTIYTSPEYWKSEPADYAEDDTYYYLSEFDE